MSFLLRAFSNMKQPEVSMLGGKRLAQFVNACCDLATNANI